MSNGEAELLVAKAPQFTAYLQPNRIKFIEKVKLAGANAGPTKHGDLVL